jgi:hypothetical protein
VVEELGERPDPFEVGDHPLRLAGVEVRDRLPEPHQPA